MGENDVSIHMAKMVLADGVRNHVFLYWGQSHSGSEANPKGHKLFRPVWTRGFWDPTHKTS